MGSPPTSLNSSQARILKMETSIKCVKYSLFLFNLLFALSGLLLIVTGGVIQGAYSQYLDFLGDQFFNTPVFLVVVGCIIFFVAFFGCCGAIKENHCMTTTFAVLLGVIFLMEGGMAHYNETGYEGVTKTWDVVQREIGCCGTQE